jgi:hypothetical protein
MNLNAVSLAEYNLSLVSSIDPSSLYRPCLLFAVYSNAGSQ